ncbi:hypothetical protein ACFE04_003020 [Oxalis oulophora]
MESIATGSTTLEPDVTVLESLQFNEEIRQLMTVPSVDDNATSFTALLELPATQAMELLHSATTTTSDVHVLLEPSTFNVVVEEDSNNLSPPLIATTDNFSESYSVPSNSSVNLEKVKCEPTDSSQIMTDDNDLDNNRRSAKRKDREKKVKGQSKKNKTVANEDAEKLPYVHVRARRGQATDSHSLAERARREKINARMKLLQELVPGCNKISGTALVLDEIINHVQNLQRQVEFLSMRLATVNPRIDFNLDSILSAESGSLVDSNCPGGMAMPLMWPDVQVNGDRQQQYQQWHIDALHQQTVWGRENNNHNLIMPENSLLSYDSSANSASLHSNHQLKLEQ